MSTQAVMTPATTAEAKSGAAVRWSELVRRRCWNSWCDGELQCKRPTHPKANVRCNKCGHSMYLNNWLRHYGEPSNDPN